MDMLSPSQLMVQKFSVGVQLESVERETRAPLGSKDYWQRWCAWQCSIISEIEAELEFPSGDPSYRAQYFRVLARHHLELMFRLYSAGAPIRSLAPWFEGLLAAWEQSQALEPAIYPPEIVHSRRTWAVNFDLYVECVWLIGLALVLDVPEPQWQRLLSLIGNEGEDAVLDTLIATRQIGRRIGGSVLYPKPCGRLLAAMTAQADGRPILLRDYVANWYPELDRKATPGRPAMYNRPYWYKFGDENFEGGAYFGRWCVEAVAAAKMFGIDDTLCCALEHYPGDLLRPDGPSIHPEPAPAPALPPIVSRPSWWRRWLAN